jgi:hypothetical protein
MVGQDQSGPLCGAEAAFHQRQIRILVAAINFVTDDRVPNVRQVYADLVFATGMRLDTEQAEWQIAVAEPA